MLYRKFVQLGLKPRASFEPGWTPRNALGAVIVRGQCPKSLKIRDDPERIYWHASSPEDDRLLLSTTKIANERITVVMLELGRSYER
jgi:hypothetical protein